MTTTDNPKIFIIVQAPTVDELEDAVNAKLYEGYEPRGGPFIRFYQDFGLRVGKYCQGMLRTGVTVLE